MAALLLLVAFGVASRTDLSLWREQVGRRSLDAGAFGSRDMTRILTALGALHRQPAADLAAEDGEGLNLDTVFGIDPLPPERISAALGIDAERVASGAPSVALILRPEDLAALEDNPEERGREWERPGYFAFVEEGRVRAASLVGVRIHGGGGRRKERYSHRIYFRRSYDQPWLFGGILPTGGSLPPKRIVLRKDGGPDHRGRQWHFVDAMSADIARRIGLEAAHSRPVALYINGRFRRVVGLIERIDRHYLLSHYGHDDFVHVDTKYSAYDPTPQVKLGDESAYYELLRWATADGPLDVDEVARRVDLDNLLDWSWLVQVLGTDDAMQGALLLDRSDPTARWFWIPWDLNISLGIWRRHGDPSKVGRFANWAFPERWKRDVRTALVGRLLKSSEAFRILYSTRFDEIVNHRLDSRWIDDLIARYRREAIRFDLDTEYLNTVDDFLERRPGVLREQIQRALGFGPSHEVQVVAPEGVPIRIGGVLYERPFRGLYVEGSLLRLSIDERDRELFGAWSHADRASREPSLEIPVERPLEVRMVTAHELAAAGVQ